VIGNLSKCTVLIPGYLSLVTYHEKPLDFHNVSNYSTTFGRREGLEMADRGDRERQSRRIDVDQDFQNRGGALDRGSGFSGRARNSDQQRRQERPGRRGGETTNRPDSLQPGGRQPNWMKPVSYTGYGPRGYRRSDERIQDDIRDRLTQHAQIDASEIEVEVQDGAVTVKGTVDDRRIKRMVEANVEMIPGVVDIHNHLRLRKPPNREGEAKRKSAEEMADTTIPAGPTPTGPAGYES
jgi:hypothetical protein